MTEFTDGPVPEQMMGEAWPSAQPGEDPVLYGHAVLSPNDPVQVRSVQTFTLTYTVGRFGLDDTGAIRVVFRAMSDFLRLQTTNPAAPSYVTARTSSGVPLNVDYAAHGVTARPRWKALTLRVTGGYLREGDQIIVTFGDTSGGSPGMVIQTFAEAGWEFRVLADVCATGHFTPIPQTPFVPVVPGDAYEWRAVLPSLRRPDEQFQLGIKCEDDWGNPTPLAAAKLRFECDHPVNGLPASYDYPLGVKSVTIEGLSAATEGLIRVRVYNADTDELVAESHPLLIRAGQTSGYWGDLHGQSGESIGVTTSAQYFDFARNKSFLDVTGHQANDFQVNNAFWAYLNELTAEYLEDGRFVTFPGYEWSGNTAVGGDRNVYFRNEGRQIHRSSHALLPERDDLDTDAQDARILFEKLKDEDVCVYAHVGGRYADIGFSHDLKLETAMEIHSAWGTFEWLLTDGFPLGHRSGVVCNSDGHKGRPGASYPGASVFGAYGGLTCFYAEELSRDGIFACMRKRHHYGTTGTRLHLDVQAKFASYGKLFDNDPHAYDNATSTEVQSVMMGDIAQTQDASVTLSIECIAQAPIERIEVRNGTEVVQVLRPFNEADLGSRIRVLWSGAEYRGRGRDTTWRGRIRFTGDTVEKVVKVNAWNKERLLEQRGADTIVFEAVTTGNYGGFDAWLSDGSAGELEIATNLGNLTASLADVDMQGVTLEAGGLDRKISAYRLPNDNPHRELRADVEIPLKPKGDNQIWVSVYTEDGFQAWSSPIFLYNEDVWPPQASE